MNPAPPTISLRRVVLPGARWLALARLVAELSTLAAAVALARLITPAEFGYAAVALIVVALAAVLGPAGITAPLVQRHELHERHLGSAAFLALALGTVMAGLTALFGYSAAPAIFSDPAADLIVLASPVWILTGSGAVSQALLLRQLRFRRQALIEGIASVAAVGVALGTAIVGLDGAALVAGAMTLVGSTAVLSLLSAPPRIPRPRPQETADVLRFGSRVAGSSLAYLGYRNIDYAILGAQVSPAQVGYYWRAFQLGVGYQGKISRVMLRMALPLYAQAATPQEIQRIRMRIVRTHATVLIPLLATFIGVAPVLVPWLFGQTWEPTVAPAQILALAGMADAIMTGSGPLMVAIGRPGALMIWNVAQLALYALLIVALAPHGITVVAVGVALFSLANTLATQGFLLRRYVGLTFRDLWLDVRAGVVVGGAVLGATTLLREVMTESALAEPVTLALLSSAAALVGAAVLRTLFPVEWTDVVAIAGRNRRDRSALSRPDGAKTDGRGGTARRL